MNKNLRKVLSIAMAALLIAGACSISMFLSAASVNDTPIEGEEAAYVPPEAEAPASDPEPIPQPVYQQPAEPESEPELPESEPEPVLAQEPIYDPMVAESDSEPAREPVFESAQEPAPEPASAEPEILYGSVSGYLWVDGDKSRATDWNGLWDSREPVLRDYTVTLFYAEDFAAYLSRPDNERVFMALPAPCAQTRTDADGAYKFEGLKPGYYVVAVYADNVSRQDYLPPVNITADNKFTLDSYCDAPYIAYTNNMDVRNGQVYMNVNAGMRLPEYIAPQSGVQSGEAQSGEATDAILDEAVPADIEPAIASFNLAMPLIAVAPQDDGTVPPQDDSIDGFEDENYENTENLASTTSLESDAGLESDEGPESDESSEYPANTEDNTFLGFTTLEAPLDFDYSDLITPAVSYTPSYVTFTVNINGTDPDPAETFKFFVQVRNEDGVEQCDFSLPYSYYSKINNPNTTPSSGTWYTDSMTGIWDFEMRHGDSITFTVARSDYQIKIAQYTGSGYNPSYTISNGESGTYHDPGFIDLDNNMLVNFEFRETLSSAAQTTNVTITMPVPATNADREKPYTFYLYLLNEGGAPIANGSLIQYNFSVQPGYIGDLTFVQPSGQLNIGSGGDGMATLYFKQGYSLTLLNLPSSYKIKIVQATSDTNYPGNFSDSAGSGNTTGDTGFRALDVSADRTFTFGIAGAAASTSTRDVRITKRIAGTSSPLLEKEFYFYVYLRNANGQPVPNGHKVSYTFEAISGAYDWSKMYLATGGSINFGDNLGRALIVLRHGYDLKFLNIPTNYQIRVEETFPQYYHSYIPSFTDTDGDPSIPGPNEHDTGLRDVGPGTTLRTIAFTNTRAPGVTINKTIANANPPNRSILFYFDIYLKDRSGNLVPQGSRVEYTFTSMPAPPEPVYTLPTSEINFGSDGRATIVLAHGYNFTLHLREGYQVQIIEREHPSYTTAFTDTQGDSGLTDTGFRDIKNTPNNPRKFVFTNTRGSGVTIIKTIPNATSELYDDEFKFYVTLQRTATGNPVPQGTLMEYTFTSSITDPAPIYPPAGVLNFSGEGVAAFPMKHGYEITLYLRSDYYVGVKEDVDPVEYVGSHTVNGSAGTGVDTGIKNVGVNAKTIEFSNVRNRGNITVSKMVSGIMANKSQDFTFTIYLTTTEWSGVPVSAGTVISYTGGTVLESVSAPANGSLTLDSLGKASFTLRHGQTATFNLQGSWGFRIIETLHTHYNTTYTDKSDNTTGGLETHVKPVGTGSRTIAYVNTSTLVPTGIEDSNRTVWVFTATAVLSAMSALIFTTARKRRARGAHQHRA